MLHLCPFLTILLCTLSASAQASSPQFLFTSGGSALSGYTLNNQTGALTPIPGSPFNERLEGGLLAIDGQDKFLFVLNPISDDVSMFQIDQTTGVLSEVPGSPFAYPPLFWRNWIELQRRPSRCCLSGAFQRFRNEWKPGPLQRHRHYEWPGRTTTVYAASLPAPLARARDRANLACSAFLFFAFFNKHRRALPLDGGMDATLAKTPNPRTARLSAGPRRRNLLHHLGPHGLRRRQRQRYSSSSGNHAFRHFNDHDFF